jgi:hypothetical protein
VDPARIALAGSSQAGWIAAKAVEQGAAPAGVFLLGAAGAAMTVAEQNLYNSGVQMRCAGLPPRDVSLALDQQRAFFAARRDPQQAAALARISRQAAGRPALSDWLFPATPDRGAQPIWYDVLDPWFDPLPVWRGYQGKAVFLFAANDDATDTAQSMKRLAGLRNVKVQLLSSAHHIGLLNSAPCQGDLRALDRMHPDFLPTLSRWAKTL